MGDVFGIISVLFNEEEKIKLSDKEISNELQTHTHTHAHNIDFHSCY